MSERIATSRSGAPTAFRGAIALHSAYDPVAEADRYAAALAIQEKTTILILIEPALGYLTGALRRRFPGRRLIAVHCSSFYDPATLVETADAEWRPGQDTDSNAFLETQIKDWEAARTQVIEWRPAIAAYGEAAAEAFRAVSTFLRRCSANDDTNRAFGRRWLRNALRNAGTAERELAPEPGDAPVVVARGLVARHPGAGAAPGAGPAAGPSLERHAESIAAARREGRCTVIAVSSAAEALLAAGIPPDLAVASDGGGWATFHLFSAARSTLPLAATLTAQVPSALFTGPILAIADGSAWQSLLLSSFGRSFLVAPQRGTVTATAIDLALAITSGPVYVAGLDLANQGLRTHARPYALDRFREDAASRFVPAYGAAYERERMIRSSSAMGVYAAWFADRAERYAPRIRTLGAAHPALSNFPRADRIESAGDREPRFRVRPLGAPAAPAVRYATALAALTGGLARGNEAIEQELGALLLGADFEDIKPDERRAAVADAVRTAAAGIA